MLNFNKQQMDKTTQTSFVQVMITEENGAPKIRVISHATNDEIEMMFSYLLENNPREAKQVINAVLNHLKEENNGK